MCQIFFPLIMKTHDDLMKRRSLHNCTISVVLTEHFYSFNELSSKLPMNEQLLGSKFFFAYKVVPIRCSGIYCRQLYHIYIIFCT